MPISLIQRRINVKLTTPLLKSCLQVVDWWMLLYNVSAQYRSIIMHLNTFGILFFLWYYLFHWKFLHGVTSVSFFNFVIFFLIVDPPEVFPLDQTSFTRNESDEFVLECSVFGVPLPNVYWIPGPTRDTLGSPQDQLLSTQDVESFLASITNFNGSRLLGAMSQCDEASGSGSGRQPQQFGSDACSYDTERTNECSVNGSLCSVPCLLEVTNDTDRFDEEGRQIVVSRLRICSLLKSDELSYTCLAINNIQNVLDTAEAAYTNLIIQGQCSTMLLAIALSDFLFVWSRVMQTVKVWCKVW